MSNKKKIIIWILVAVFIGIGLWLIFKKPKTVEVGATTPSVPDAIFPLKLGSNGGNVKNLQRYLNLKYSAGLSVDGDLGNKTLNAMMNYLKRDNISADVWNKWDLASYK